MHPQEVEASQAVLCARPPWVAAHHPLPRHFALLTDLKGGIGRAQASLCYPVKHLPTFCGGRSRVRRAAPFWIQFAEFQILSLYRKIRASWPAARRAADSTLQAKGAHL